jgi:hypothetical protein
MYKIFRNSFGIVDAVNRDDGASLAFDPMTQTFDELHPLTIELREWEKEHGALDLSIQPPPPPPLEWVRQQKIDQITCETAYRQDALVAGYASAERDSWDTKIEQSKMFLQTKNLEDAKYLKLEAIATTGDLSEESLLAIVETLAQRILGKADELLSASSRLAGKRTRLISIINKSSDIKFIESLTFDAEL